jgi:hypothetical protein
MRSLEEESRFRENGNGSRLGAFAAAASTSI